MCRVLVGAGQEFAAQPQILLGEGPVHELSVIPHELRMLVGQLLKDIEPVLAENLRRGDQLRTEIAMKTMVKKLATSLLIF